MSSSYAEKALVVLGEGWRLGSKFLVWGFGNGDSSGVLFVLIGHHF